MAESDWLVPEWPAPARVKAIFTTRAGGVSQAPFDSLNLGDHVGDAPDAVATNRQRLGGAIHAAPVFLQQVHGVAVAHLDRPAPAPGVLVADACLSAEVGQACTIMVADCLPILLTDRAGRWVAAAHAGWRGLAGRQGVGVIESVLAALRARAAEAGESVADADWLAWLGPCIGPTAFEVGPEVQAAFTDTLPAAQVCFVPQPQGKFLADLAGLARQRLQAAGVTSMWGNDGSADWCTVGQASRFFSHRRDAGRLGSTGRMAACIWLG
ncbi:peptidoglycan editing factor PgeF [Hydrogenophaga defluvii]|uniref:Purine nucleoside phosphorylase n=1 Tax=Hydrogenophaga defluvii TaxID=249410 RepID=A0ABW2SIZ6_9BURK